MSQQTDPPGDFIDLVNVANRITEVRFTHTRRDGSRHRVELDSRHFFEARRSLRAAGLPCGVRDVCGFLGGQVEADGLI